MKRLILIIASALILLPANSQELIIKDAKYDKYLKYGIEEISTKPQNKKIFTFSTGVVGDFSATFDKGHDNTVGGGAGVVFDFDFFNYFGFQPQVIFSKRSRYETKNERGQRREEEESGFSYEVPIMVSGRLPIGKYHKLQLDIGYEFLSAAENEYHGLVVGLAYTYRMLYVGMQSFIQPNDNFYDLSVKAGVLFKCQKKNRTSAKGPQIMYY